MVILLVHMVLGCGKMVRVDAGRVANRADHHRCQSLNVVGVLARAQSVKVTTIGGYDDGD